MLRSSQFVPQQIATAGNAGTNSGAYSAKSGSYGSGYGAGASYDALASAGPSGEYKGAGSSYTGTQTGKTGTSTGNTNTAGSSATDISATMYAKSHVALGKVNVSNTTQKSNRRQKRLYVLHTYVHLIDPFSLTKNRLSTRLRHHHSVLRVVKMLACPVVTVPHTYSSRLYHISCTSHFIRMAAIAATKGPTRVRRTKLKRSLDIVLVIGPVATKHNEKQKTKFRMRHKGRTK